ncbi:hypothetical protein AWB64_06117 [Caballeronia sordidicola]|uniref:Uncharacterized protein n=1 Tax=Caballeronia sordidicola TaxID=196367 RepID=A0A158IG81_CABSO|nr:hypothetical protein AWB64_06117 [Caballeronia sordidicola]
MHFSALPLFHVLDYFKDEAQAIGHSREWARDWVDSRG